MKKMVDIWRAGRIQIDQQVWVKTMPDPKACIPQKGGSILCEGRVSGSGIDSEWEALLTVSYRCPITNTLLSFTFSEDERKYEECFFVVK